MKRMVSLLTIGLLLPPLVNGVEPVRRRVVDFNRDWRFHLGEIEEAKEPQFDDSYWRKLDVPHDWSIEGQFSAEHPAGAGGGALPGGIGWYRKHFSLSDKDRGLRAFIEFDGVYRNSEVWINGRYLGKRPYGYSSFYYELTPFLLYGKVKNVLAVRVDNSQQPNSRWYSGSGIYRHVRLTLTPSVYIDHGGIYITTPRIEDAAATAAQCTEVRNTSDKDAVVRVRITLLDANGEIIAESEAPLLITAGAKADVKQELRIPLPKRWSDSHPYLYQSVTELIIDGRITDRVITPFGIRSFEFDPLKGFILNGIPTKLRGVCMHHDLGCLGAAINLRALQRQLEILKEMGCNALRTSHNPPAPELLDLCDQMGFLVMDEAFDVWRIKKTAYDYSLDFDEWHERDLRDFVRRDRNHPCVIMWSIGNEIMEQWHESGTEPAKQLADIVRSEDPTRPITSGCNDPQPNNYIIRSGALDVIGYNYHHESFLDFPQKFPGQKFVASETGSAIATRGSYDMPSDSVRIWPRRWDQPETYNADYTCSSYDNCRVGWGSTHQDTWRLIKKHDFLSGMFYWTGFDYLGEPTPYDWPARSSYFGIIDLAGFPKDAYYFYQAEWTDKPVLHLFPHWNWREGQMIDVWVYTNCERVELFLNGESLGEKTKGEDEMHLCWRTSFKPGTLCAVGGRNGEILTREISTAGAPKIVRLTPDRSILQADGRDLAFVTVDILDERGNLVPYADNLVTFSLRGPGRIIGVDNGCQISHEPFKASYRRAFHGKCLVVVQTMQKKGKIKLRAASAGLTDAVAVLVTE